MKTLKIEELSKNFGSTEVLRKINLEIDEGNFLVLLGPSGCGKSTLLNIIAGLETINEGNVHIDDYNVSKVEPKDRNIAMVFQSYALYPSMNVRENMIFGLKQAKVSKEKIEEQLEKVSKFLQVDALLERKPSQLSGGQRQRVAIGRALVREPRIFLFDEPLSNLDAKLRVEMRREIKKLHQQLKTTVVYVTHDQSEALTMSNRIAVFDDGVIQQLADPVTLYEKPENSFVAQFIGENNQMVGTVSSVSKGIATINLDSGAEVRALAANISGVGSRTTLSVRPERCIIVTKKSATVSRLDAKIEELIYLGDHIRCRMNVAGDDQFMMKVPNTSSQLGLEIGATLKIGWQNNDCRALDFNELV